jgi:hypothetical protein
VAAQVHIPYDVQKQVLKKLFFMLRASIRTGRNVEKNFGTFIKNWLCVVIFFYPPFVCVCICMYLFIYLCVYVRLCMYDVCIYICMYVSTYVQVCR